MLQSFSSEKLLPDGVGEKNRKWAVILALSSLRVTSPAPGLYCFIVFYPCVASWKPLFLPWEFSMSLSLFCDLTLLAWFIQVWVFVCVWLYFHLFFQQNNIISLIFYLAASSIPPEASSLSGPLWLWDLTSVFLAVVLILRQLRPYTGGTGLEVQRTREHGL